MLDSKNLDNAKQLMRYLIAYGAEDISTEWHIFDSSFQYVITGGMWNEVGTTVFTPHD